MDGVLAGILDAVECIGNVQAGVASGAGNVTINAVDEDKAIVISRSKGSAGYVGATGTISLAAPSGQVYSSSSVPRGYPNTQSDGYWPPYTGSLSAGSTSLTVKEYSAYLVDSTTIYCDGPCEWQVINNG